MRTVHAATVVTAPASAARVPAADTLGTPRPVPFAEAVAGAAREPGAAT